MYKKVLLVESSLEARTTAIFVQTASKFSSLIEVEVDNKTVNGKSIMGMISLGIRDGQEITVMANGDDEQKAVEELSNFFTKGK